MEFLSAKTVSNMVLIICSYIDMVLGHLTAGTGCAMLMASMVSSLFLTIITSHGVSLLTSLLNFSIHQVQHWK